MPLNEEETIKDLLGQTGHCADSLRVMAKVLPVFAAGLRLSPNGAAAGIFALTMDMERYYE